MSDSAQLGQELVRKVRLGARRGLPTLAFGVQPARETRSEGDPAAAGMVESAPQTLEDFEARIEAALAHATEEDRAAALTALYYTPETDEQTRGFIDLAVGMFARRQSPDISFVPLDPDFPMVKVLDGYEYRRNLEPLGLVKLSGGKRGGSSRLPYAKQSDRYVFPATIRRLVNADAKPEASRPVLFSQKPVTMPRSFSAFLRTFFIVVVLVLAATGWWMWR